MDTIWLVGMRHAMLLALVLLAGCLDGADGHDDEGRAEAAPKAARAPDFGAPARLAEASGATILEQPIDVILDVPPGACAPLEGWRCVYPTWDEVWDRSEELPLDGHIIGIDVTISPTQQPNVLQGVSLAMWVQEQNQTGHPVSGRQAWGVHLDARITHMDAVHPGMRLHMFASPWHDGASVPAIDQVHVHGTLQVMPGTCIQDEEGACTHIEQDGIAHRVGSD